jgi:hypothetical protein
MEIKIATQTPNNVTQLSKLTPGSVFTLVKLNDNSSVINEVAYLVLNDPYRNKEGRVCFACMESGSVYILDSETPVISVACTLLKYN